jgi:transposase InsO family protein
LKTLFVHAPHVKNTNGNKKSTENYRQNKIKVFNHGLLLRLILLDLGQFLSKIGPRKTKLRLSLYALMIINIHTCFMEIVALPNNESATVTAAFEQYWLYRYPQPFRCIIDNGSEFTGIKFQELLHSYGITCVCNPQANAVLERPHQVIANMLRTSVLTNYQVDTLQDQQPLLTPVRTMGFEFYVPYNASSYTRTIGFSTCYGYANNIFC